MAEPAKVSAADLQQAQPLWHEDTRGRPGGPGGGGRGGGRFGGGYNNGPQQQYGGGGGGQFQRPSGGMLPDAAHRMLNVSLLPHAQVLSPCLRWAHAS